MPRKTILLIFLVPTLLIALTSNGFSQTSDSKIVGKAQTVAFLIEQNKAANDLIEKQAARIADLEAELVAERENSASIEKSYSLARTEIGYLKQSNEALSRAVAVNEQTIELLKADNEKQRAATRKAKKEKWKAYGVAAVAVALKLLIP